MIQKILDFWFSELEPKQWFMKDPALDETIKQKFESTYHEIVAGEHKAWEDSAEGCLAMILVLDQFSRNMFRDEAQAFAADNKALAVSQLAVKKAFDKALDPKQRTFVYMPYMHSEDPAVHEVAVDIFTAHGNAMSLDYEMKHKAIIDRFGRYPHRNKILGRTSTAEELDFLNQPGSSF